MKTISFHEAVIGRGGKPLLKLDGLEIPPGLNLFVAPNGFGKTSLLLSLARLLPLMSGRITGIEDALYISEYLSFPKYVYPIEWVEYVCRRSKLAGELESLAGDFRMKPELSRYIGRLSQGERRKITWMAAHLSKRPVLLLDEPLDGLDFFGIQAARKLLEAWKKESRIVCIVAHQLGELLDLADRTFMIRDQSLHATPIRPEGLRQTLIDFYSGL